MSINRRDFIKLSAISSGLALLGSPKNLFSQTQKDNAPAGSIEAKAGFSFCVIADPHCAEKPAAEGQNTPVSGVDRFFACLSEMEKLQGDEKPDFILILGDIHLPALEPHLGKIKIPLHPIAGNHETAEIRAKMRKLFANDFIGQGKESDYYSFVHKGVRFIGMCDAAADEHIGQLCAESIIPRGQCEWLEEQLSQKEPQKIIFAHIPPEPEGRDSNMYLSRNDSRFFNKLVTEKEPTAMFFGHMHMPTKQIKIGKTQSFTVRSSCWNSNKEPTGFLLVKVSADSISTREILTS